MKDYCAGSTRSGIFVAAFVACTSIFAVTSIAQPQPSAEVAIRAAEKGEACRYSFVLSYSGIVGRGSNASSRTLSVRFRPEQPLGERYSIHGEEQPEHVALMQQLHLTDRTGYPGDLRTVLPTGEMAFRDVRYVEEQDGLSIYAFRPEVIAVRPADPSGGKIMAQLEGELSVAPNDQMVSVSLKTPASGLQDNVIGLATIEKTDMFRDFVATPSGQIVLRTERSIGRVSTFGRRMDTNSVMTISDLTAICDPATVESIAARERGAAR